MPILAKQGKILGPGAEIGYAYCSDLRESVLWMPSRSPHLFCRHLPVFDTPSWIRMCLAMQRGLTA